MSRAAARPVRGPAPAKGATRIADVPPTRRAELSNGEAEAHTLAEWLSAVTSKLIARILPDVGLPAAATRLLADTDTLERLGVKGKLEHIGIAISSELVRSRESDAITQRLATHPSNYAREWLAFAIATHPELSLRTRLDRIRPLAADRNLNVREAAWLAMRRDLAADIRSAIGLLRPWVRDGDPNIRRFAIEATRPRGVWATHIAELKTSPQIGLPLLEPVRSDSSDYVRRAVANWLNDASKTQPEWVAAVCARWLHQSPTEETAWICSHALRTMRRQQPKPQSQGPQARMNKKPLEHAPPERPERE